MPFARNFYHSALSHCEHVVDFLLPHRCSVCMAELATAQALCPTCWKDLHFINSPICARTGVPLPFDLGPQSVSLSAMRFPPAYDRARCALIYNGTARQLIHRFKFLIDLKLLRSSLRGCRLLGKIYCMMLIISSLCPYICFALLFVVIINRLNWRAGSHS